MEKVENLYEEYLVCGNGKYSYRESYNDALILSAEYDGAKIYGAAYLPSGIKGLLQRKWVKI
jgi:hypothetical protein